MRNRTQSVATFTIAAIPAWAMGLAIEPVFDGSSGRASEPNNVEVAADVMVGNGVIHVVGQVIVPN